MRKFKPTSEQIQDAMIIFFCQGGKIESLPPELCRDKYYVGMKTYGSNAFELFDRELRVGNKG